MCVNGYYVYHTLLFEFCAVFERKTRLLIKQYSVYVFMSLMYEPVGKFL